MNNKYKSGILSVLLGSILLTGCSVAERVVYRPEINQGNYLALEDIAKVELGMDKTQIMYLLGSPMLTSLFGDNIWHYVFRRQPHRGVVEQSKLILTFDENDRLIDMSGSE